MTYQQQSRYWHKQQITKCPRDKLLEDLKVEIHQWQEEGDSIILMADMNDDIRSADIKEFCQALNLIDPTSHLHGKAKFPTHQRGSTTIDGIFISTKLLPQVKSSFLAFGKATHSNHHMVWLDIQSKLMGVHQPKEIIHAKARRLKCQDPQIVHKYNQFLKEAVVEQGIEHQLECLQHEIQQVGPSKDQHQAYNQLNKMWVVLKHQVEAQCHKIHGRKIPWTPPVTQAIQQVLFWKGILKRNSKGTISTMVLKRRANRGAITWNPDYLLLTLQQIKTNISNAYQDLKEIKIMADQRDTWLGQMIAAQAAAQNIPKKCIWQRIRTTESIRKMASLVKGALQPVTQRTGLLSVMPPQQAHTTTRQEVHTRTALKNACLDEGFLQIHPSSQHPLFTTTPGTAFRTNWH